MSSKNVTSKGTPIAAKGNAQTTPIAAVDFDDRLQIDPKLKAEITGKGMVFRWINGTEFKKNYGYDHRQWQPYKRSETSVALENNSYGYADAEGFIRRGDLLLAVRSKEIHDMERQRNRSRIDSLSGNQQKKAAEALKQSFKDAGLDGNSTVIEGYDDNE